jgi:hypothetical protein
MHPLILLAAEVAISKIEKDPRNFLLGAVGVRNDGIIVSARNGPAQESIAHGKGWSFPQCHAEYRCVKKMDRGGTIYVARVGKNGMIGMSKPCAACETLLKNRGISRAFYSVSPTEYRVMSLNS